MSDTSVSLLERLRLSPDPASWQRLVDLYTPLIRDWLRRQGLQASDTDDLVQDALQIVIQELPNFRHDLRRGAFRRWLRTITVNRLRTYWRKQRSRPIATGDSDFDMMLNQLADPDSQLSKEWDRQHDQHVARQLLELLAGDFEPATWEAFRMLVLEGRETTEVAAHLGISPNAVRIAKSRVLARFRQEAAGLIDE
jgi:RNA polymerase sigma-70 factor, ECF subfamily